MSTTTIQEMHYRQGDVVEVQFVEQPDKSWGIEIAYRQNADLSKLVTINGKEPRSFSIVDRAIRMMEEKLRIALDLGDSGFGNF